MSSLTNGSAILSPRTGKLHYVSLVGVRSVLSRDYRCVLSRCEQIKLLRFRMWPGQDFLLTLIRNIHSQTLPKNADDTSTPDISLLRLTNVAVDHTLQFDAAGTSCRCLKKIWSHVLVRHQYISCWSLLFCFISHPLKTHIAEHYIGVFDTLVESLVTYVTRLVSDRLTSHKVPNVAMQSVRRSSVQIFASHNYGRIRFYVISYTTTFFMDIDHQRQQQIPSDNAKWKVLLKS